MEEQQRGVHTIDLEGRRRCGIQCEWNWEERRKSDDAAIWKSIKNQVLTSISLRAVYNMLTMLLLLSV